MADALRNEYLADLGYPPGHGQPTTAAVIVALVSLVQWRSVRWGSRFQTGTSAVTAGRLLRSGSHSVRSGRAVVRHADRYRAAAGNAGRWRSIRRVGPRAAS